jgi:dienelactone hydrolase
MFRDHVSLMHGWVPVTLQVLAAVALGLAVGWRSKRWRMLWLPISVAAGAVVALLTYWVIASNGLAGDPAPRGLWIWITLAGTALSVAILGWRSAGPRRRVASLLAVPLTVLCTALMVNLWVGYSPTVQTAWGQLTDGPLPGQIDRATVAEMVAAQSVPDRGRVVPVDIPADASKFKHRGELVYLPPAYFASDPPPALPVVMMIGGQFNTAADWIRSANAVSTIDKFAAKHDGNAPVFVFVDSGGSFNNDTGCVNGLRGNAADHLTKDVRPYLIDNFGVSDDPAQWAAVGWSTGGTCALNMAVKYPELFTAFVNIDGDIAPSAGTKAQTIERLFGGDAAAYAQWDPATLIAGHGRYQGVAGWFAVSTPGATHGPPLTGPALPEPPANSSAETADTPAKAANTLCRLGSEYGIDCAVVPQSGKHDWPFAARVLDSALPWLAGQIGTPEVPVIPLPGSPRGTA